MAPGMAVRLAVRLTILWVCLVGSSLARAEVPASVNSPVTRAGSSGTPPPQLDPRSVSDPAASAPMASARPGDGQLRPVRRSVAVIDLANDQSVRDVAYKVLDLLASHVELAPPAISDGAALVDKLPPDDEFLLFAAQRKLFAAEQNLGFEVDGAGALRSAFDTCLNAHNRRLSDVRGHGASVGFRFILITMCGCAFFEQIA